MFNIGNLKVNVGEKKQDFVEIYNTGIKVPVTIINGSNEGKTVLITAGIHGAEYPGIQTAIELAKELEVKDIKGKLIIISPVNVEAFRARVSEIVPQDGKNINRIFPGDIEGTLAEQIGHFITHECQSKADFYIDMHGGDLHELAMPFVYYPGIADEKVINESKKVAESLNVKYITKSGAKTGAYNSAALRGLPSILIERGGRGFWTKDEVIEYKKDIKRALKCLDILDNAEEKIHNPKNITKATYLESDDLSGLWYPTVNAGDVVKEGQLIGIMKDFFGNTIKEYYANLHGVVMYMTVSLSVPKETPLIAYGEIKE